MKGISKINNAATNPIMNIIAAGINKAVEERRIVLKMGSLLPLITDLTNFDVTSTEILYNKTAFTGKAQVTDQMPNTVPTVVTGTIQDKARMKWISAGVEVSREKRAFIDSGKTITLNDEVMKAMRVIQEEEDRFLRKGVQELGVSGIDNIEGTNIYVSSKWATLTGEQILEDIRKGWAAHTLDGRFDATSMWIDKTLYDELYKPYSASEPKSVLEVLQARNWFENIESIPGFGGAVIVEDNEECFGHAVQTPLRIGASYMEGTTEIFIIEEHVSGIIIKQPESITKFEGVI
ncbi:MAG: encapsulin [Cetobacterium sp.]|uniref:encapsulin n=1 Tax=Cetobacterium sp. TaxID=2071632 RepID=UPI002FC9416C